jgi:hypothetical protein
MAIEVHCERVLVLYEPGRAGKRALDLAKELAEAEDASLTVACQVPRASSGCCTGSAAVYNRCVLEAVGEDLNEARSLLGDAAYDARFELLIDGVDPPLSEWSVSSRFDLILLPARRGPFRRRRHPQAGRLERATLAQVRVVSGAGADAG